MEKKVLFISYNGMTDPLGQSQVLPYLFELAKYGYEITVLSMEKKDRMAKEGKYISQLIKGGGLHWHPLTFHKALPVISKMQDRYLLKKAARQLCRERGFDIIHCRSYVSAEVGLDLKRKFSSRLIFDMRGFWADEKKDSGHWNTKNPVYNSIYQHYKSLEKRLLLQSDATVVLTHAAKTEIATWSLGPNVDKKVHVIPCCADLVHFSDQNVDPVLKAKFYRELKLEGASPVFCYLGSIGEAYAIGEMLYFFNQLKVKYPKAKFLFLTKDEPELVLKELEKFPNILPSDIAVHFATRKEVPTYLSLCTFSIFFYKPTYSRIACSPTKFAEISGLGLPVICNMVGDLNQIYLNGLPHAVIKDLSKQSIDGLVSLVEGFRAANKESIRSFALEQYDLQNGVSRYRSIYRELSA